jgi:hypothetical protein
MTLRIPIRIRNPDLMTLRIPIRIRNPDLMTLRIPIRIRNPDPAPWARQLRKKALFHGKILICL